MRSRQTAGGHYAYILGLDGHIQGHIDLLCDNDEEAKQQVEQLLDGPPIELWQQARRIATYEPKK